VKKSFILVFFVVAFTVAEGITLLLGGVVSNSFLEYADSFEKSLKINWGVDSDISFVSQNRIDHLRNDLFNGGEIQLNRELMDYVKKYNLESTILVLPVVTKFKIAPKRTYIVGAETEAVLDVRFIFYDLSAGKEIFIGNAKEEFTRAERPIFWRSVNTVSLLNASEKEEFANRLIDGVLEESANLLAMLKKYHSSKLEIDDINDTTAVINSTLKTVDDNDSSNEMTNLDSSETK
jgi:hypothetical protein